jgi:hypothetical protein
MDAVNRKDARYLISVLHPEVENSFGGDGGVAEFREKWRPEEPNSEVWVVIREILSLGGCIGQGKKRTTFLAPYVSARWPHGFDEFEHCAILKQNVEVRSRPSTSSPVIEVLSYDVVKLEHLESPIEEAGGMKRNQWAKIITPKGQHGYVLRQFVRSPLDYRARFWRVQGKWFLRSLIAGD